MFLFFRSLSVVFKRCPSPFIFISSLVSWLGNKTLSFSVDVRKIIGHKVSGGFLQVSKILGDSLFILTFVFCRFSSISVFMINKLQEVHCKLTEYYWRWFQYRFPIISVFTLKSKCLLFWKHLMNIWTNLFYGYLGGFRERERVNKLRNNYTLKTFFINTLLVCMLFEFSYIVFFYPFF